MEKEVDLEELKAVAIALIDSAIRENKGGTVRIRSDADFYWEVPSDALYGVKGKQPQLDVGCLSDDWEFIRSMAQDPSGATPLALIHLAPILRFIGEGTNEKK